MSRIGLCRTLVAVTAWAGLACLAPAARAQPVPAGFEIVRLTYDLGMHSVPDINDRGDVVWASSYPPYESDIWLYRDGKVQRVTNGEWYDIWPAINNRGQMVWTRGDDWSPPFWIVFDVGNGPQWAPDPGGVSALGADMNDEGLIAWSQRLAVNPSNDEIFTYDPASGTFQQLTSNGLSNQSPRLNRYGDMVWTRFDDRVQPWISTIMLYSAGQTLELTNAAGQPQVAHINDRLQVVWRCGYGCPTLGVHLWEAGTVSVICGDGSAPRINNKGTIVFVRFNEAQQRWHLWVYRDGNLFEIPGLGVAFGIVGANVNTRGEIAWVEYINSNGDTAIFLMRRINVRAASTALDGNAPAGSQVHASTGRPSTD